MARFPLRPATGRALALSWLVGVAGCNAILGIENARIASDAAVTCSEGDCEVACEEDGGCDASASCEEDVCTDMQSSGVDVSPTDAGDSPADAGDVDGALPALAVLGVTPGSLDFGPVVQGLASAELTLDVTNDGSQATLPLGIELKGAGAAVFEVRQDGCAAMKLPANGKCTLGVRFVPRQVGVWEATLQISGANRAEAALRGEGVAPGALVSEPSAGAFAAVELGAAEPWSDLTFSIRNSGQAVTGALATNLSGTAAADFVIREDTCTNAMLASAATCAVSVRFMPTAGAGSRSATLLVRGDPGGVLPINLAGRANAPATFAMSANTLDLGTVDVGSTGQALPVIVTNRGDVAGTPRIALSDSRQFVVTDGCSNKSLGSGATCQVTFAIRPLAAGAHTLDMTVGQGSAATTVRVSGIGREARALTVTLAGTGSGTVTAPGISCPGDCTESYARTVSDPQITLTASYDATTVDVAWSAPCVGSTTSCAVTLGQSQTVTVTFALKRFNVTVTRSAEVSGATGIVRGGGLVCPSTCTIAVNAGSRLALSAEPSAGYHFGVWNGAGCIGAGQTCTTDPIRANTTIDAKFTRANVIFVTTTSYLATDFAAHDPVNGSDPSRGADRYCQERAAAGSAPGLSGRTWVSLITNSTTEGYASSASRLGTKRGWVRTDGKPFGDDIGSFIEGFRVFYPPSYDENGARVPTDLFGVAVTGSGCKRWTSTANSDQAVSGLPYNGGFGWNRGRYAYCSDRLKLYCASVDYTATVVAPGAPTGAKLGFMTQGVFNPAGSTGLSAADALCQSEASAASFSGTFRALLASSNPLTNAIGRFPAGSGPWLRPDGVAIGSMSDMTQVDLRLQAPISVTPIMRYAGNEGAWSGAADPTVIGQDTTTCTPAGRASWTGGASESAHYGTSYSSHYGFFDFSQGSCGGGGIPVYCLQL